MKSMAILQLVRHCQSRVSCIIQFVTCLETMLCLYNRNFQKKNKTGQHRFYMCICNKQLCTSDKLFLTDLINPSQFSNQVLKDIKPAHFELTFTLSGPETIMNVSQDKMTCLLILLPTRRKSIH